MQTEIWLKVANKMHKPTALNIVLSRIITQFRLKPVFGFRRFGVLEIVKCLMGINHNRFEIAAFLFDRDDFIVLPEKVFVRIKLRNGYAGILDYCNFVGRMFLWNDLVFSELFSM
jgi:hypothetical protein